MVLSGRVCSSVNLTVLYVGPGPLQLTDVGSLTFNLPLAFYYCTQMFRIQLFFHRALEEGEARFVWITADSSRPDFSGEVRPPAVFVPQTSSTTLS